MKKKETLKGGKADGKPDSRYSKKQLEMGIRIEKEHTNNPAKAKEISKDHLEEIPDYYTRLKKMEKSAFIVGFEKKANAKNWARGIVSRFKKEPPPKSFVQKVRDKIRSPLKRMDDTRKSIEESARMGGRAIKRNTDILAMTGLGVAGYAVGKDLGRSKERKIQQEYYRRSLERLKNS